MAAICAAAQNFQNKMKRWQEDKLLGQFQTLIVMFCVSYLAGRGYPIWFGPAFVAIGIGIGWATHGYRKEKK